MKYNGKTFLGTRTTLVKVGDVMKQITTWERIKIAFTAKIVLIVLIFSVLFTFLLGIIYANLSIEKKFPAVCVGIMRISKNECYMCQGDLVLLTKYANSTPVKDISKCY